MDIVNAVSVCDGTAEAINDVLDQLKNAHESYQLLIVYFNTQHDINEIKAQLTRNYDCPIALSTSCQGALGISSTASHAKAQIVVFAIHDPEGSYGVGAASLSLNTPQQCAQDAVMSALSTSPRPFDAPAMIWTLLAPGQEEEILEGIETVVGARVPIFGGSSADNDVSGQWQQGTNKVTGNDLVVVVTMLPSTRLGYSYSSGYEATDTKLIAQDCENRIIGRFDGEHAASVYDRVTQGAISHAIDGGNVLGNTTLYPLGREITNEIGIPEFLLSHPDSVTRDGKLTLFSHIEEGESLTLMTGSIDGLVSRAAIVAQNAIDLLPEGSECTGVLMIYCGGCMLTIGDDVTHMQETLVSQLPNIPICAAYTFGEQGVFLDGKNRHGNLMISAVAFAR